MSKRVGPLLGLLLLSLLVACVRSQPDIIYITATFEPAAVSNPPQPTAPLTGPFVNPTPDPTRPAEAAVAREHVVQVGDTLYGIALTYNVSLDALLAVNELPDPNSLSVGQIIHLPEIPDVQTNAFKIIPDSRLVRGPGSAAFDVAAFVNQQPGYVRVAADLVPTNLASGAPLEELLTTAQIIERVSLEYSVDPRILLALLEYRSGWLTNPNPPDELKTHPLISVEASGDVDRTGLYRQLAWTANELNRGYYDWKTRGVTVLEFDDGTRMQFAPGLNAGTVAVQYFLSLNSSYASWLPQVDQTGLFQTYAAYFADPFAGAVEPLVPAGVQQPDMLYPFASGETWYFTGGPHGGWGSGSAWAAIDFAPPDEHSDSAPLCYTSGYSATAVAAGVIARSATGLVILDLDGDGDEATGWSVLYLHLASDDRVAQGAWVQPGDRIGRSSCEGGFSTATHLHLARRFNGEWIPAYCDQCPEGGQRPQFILSGWNIVGLARQEYQGYMYKEGETRLAEQGRESPENHVSW